MTNQVKYGKCPVCNGSGRVPCPYDKETTWLNSMSGYDAATHTSVCRNCGGQTMSGRATGEVRINKYGIECHHEYESRTLGRCFYGYTCKHCGDYYTIDSGD